MNLFLLACILSVAAMPYNVPLQGAIGGKRTLVIVDDLDKISSFSMFFSDLASRGHKLSIQQAESTNLKLKNYGENLYDNIIFLAPGVEKFNSMGFDDFSEFVEEGGNLIITANKDISDELRNFAESFGVTFDKKGSEVIDHFQYEPTLDKTLQHLTILASNTIKSKAVLGSFNEQASQTPILFRGIAHKASNDNILSVRILAGNPSTYSYFPNKAINNEGPFSAGDESLLVSAIQGRNNARVLIAGSVDMFTNTFYGVRLATQGASKTGNRAFVTAVTQWTLGERGVLRFRDIAHHKSDGNPPDVILHEKERPDLPVTLYPDPEITRNSLVYRIKDDIVYSMIVEEFYDNEWHPFNANDMQMEFVMLDPYVRKTMVVEDENKGKFVARFTAPDNYGVFKFRVLYRRTGYSVLHAETQVSIRPFKHDEYERFIFSAYPYYASAFSALGALFIFSIFFLFSS